MVTQVLLTNEPENAFWNQCLLLKISGSGQRAEQDLVFKICSSTSKIYLVPSEDETWAPDIFKVKIRFSELVSVVDCMGIQRVPPAPSQRPAPLTANTAQTSSTLPLQQTEKLRDDPHSFNLKLHSCVPPCLSEGAHGFHCSKLPPKVRIWPWWSLVMKRLKKW